MTDLDREPYGERTREHVDDAPPSAPFGVVRPYTRWAPQEWGIPKGGIEGMSPAVGGPVDGMLMPRHLYSDLPVVVCDRILGHTHSYALERIELHATCVGVWVHTSVTDTEAHAMLAERFPSADSTYTAASIQTADELEDALRAVWTIPDNSLGKDFDHAYELDRQSELLLARTVPALLDAARGRLRLMRDAADGMDSPHVGR